MTIWTMGLDRMFQVMGEPCTVDVSTGCEEFYGILDINSAVEEQALGLTVVGSILKVQSCLADKLEFNDVITCRNKKWFVREVNLEDDGYTANVIITEKKNT